MVKMRRFSRFDFASFTEGLFMPVILDLNLDSGQVDLDLGGLYQPYPENEMLRWSKQEGKIHEQWHGMGKITSILISLLGGKKGN